MLPTGKTTAVLRSQCLAVTQPARSTLEWGGIGHIRCGRSFCSTTVQQSLTQLVGYSSFGFQRFLPMVEILRLQECMTGICIVLYIACGCVFLDSTLNEPYHIDTYNMLGTGLLVMTALTISAVLLLFALDVYLSQNASKIGSTVTASLKGSIKRIRLSLPDPLPHSGGLQAWDQIQQILPRADIELLEAACRVDGKFDAELALAALLPETSVHESLLGRTMSQITQLGGMPLTQGHNKLEALVSNALGTDECASCCSACPCSW